MIRPAAPQPDRVFEVVGVAKDEELVAAKGDLGAAGMAGFGTIGVANEERSPF